MRIPKSIEKELIRRGYVLDEDEPWFSARGKRAMRYIKRKEKNKFYLVTVCHCSFVYVVEILIGYVAFDIRSKKL